VRTSQPERSRPHLLDAPWRTALILSGILLVGFLLRWVHVGDRSLWFDEAYTWRLVQFSYTEIIARSAQDNHPPLFHLLLKCWATIFGDSALALRALSVVFGQLTILGMYLFMAEAGRWLSLDEAQRRGLALFVAALVALSALQVRYSWEARMYPLGTALAAGSSWMLLRALSSPTQRSGPWIGYAILCLLFAYTHTYALFTLAAQALLLMAYLMVLVRRGNDLQLVRRLACNLVLAAAIVTIGFAPWIPALLAQREQVKDAFWTKPVSFELLLGLGQELLLEPKYPVIGSRYLFWPAGLACGLFVVAVVVLLCVRPNGVRCLLAAQIAIPIGLSIGLSLWDTPILCARYWTFAHLFVLAGVGVLCLRLPRLRIPVMGAVLALSLGLSLHCWMLAERAPKLGAHAAGLFLAEHRQPEEPVVVCSAIYFFGIQHYLNDSGPCWLHQRRVVHHDGAAALTSEAFITNEQIEDLPHPRLWVVNRTGPVINWTVPVSPDWVEVSVHRLPTSARNTAQLVVIEYQRRTMHPQSLHVR
jgi:hypothetical protein